MAGYDIEVEELADQISSVINQEGFDGLSITGGEPMEQVDSLLPLINLIRERIKTESTESAFNILMFSGLTFEQIEKQEYQLADAVDAMVCGPYERNRPRAGRLLASDNQELVILNEAFRSYFETYAQDAQRALQFDVGESGIYLVGMPDSGDLEQFEKELAKRGVMLGEVSWHN